MMMKIEELARVGTSSLNPNFTHIRPEGLPESFCEELNLMLSERDGFYAFESALHVFPSVDYATLIGLDSWNDRALWKNEYGSMADAIFCFAEDIFGAQFCFYDGKIYLFDPETGSKEVIASNLEGWADCVLTDYQFLTGYPLAVEWQKKNHPIPMGKRLIPKIPFVCGGEFSINNLVTINAVQGMRSRANLARQIKNLPDGSKISFKIVDG